MIRYVQNMIAYDREKEYLVVSTKVKTEFANIQFCLNKLIMTFLSTLEFGLKINCIL